MANSKALHSHIGSMPDIIEDMPVYKPDSTEMIILFPIFHSEIEEISQESEIRKLHFYLKMAIYNKRAYLRNTDALEKGIPIKFYMQTKAYHLLRDALEINNITQDDVILFELYRPKIGRLHNPNAKNLGYKLLPATDRRLEHYERILINDCDHFLCKTPVADTEKYSITAQIAAVPENRIGAFKAGGTYSRTETPPFAKNHLKVAKGCDPEVFVRLVEKTVGDISKVYGFDEWTTTTNGSQYVFSRMIHEQFPDLMEFLAKGIRYLRNDESITTIFDQLHATEESPRYNGVFGMARGIKDFAMPPYVDPSVTLEEFRDIQATEPFYYLHNISGTDSDKIIENEDKILEVWETHL